MKQLLYISLLLNLLLAGALVYIGCFRTDYIRRVCVHLSGNPYVPERADNDCVESWNNCIQQLNYQVDVVFFGDSITEGGDWQDALPDYKVVNMGYVGEDTRGMLRRVNAVASLKPRCVFLMAGINDLHSRKIEDFKESYIWLVDSLLKAMPQMVLYLESILPVSEASDYCENEVIKHANLFIQNVAGEHNLKYVDLFSMYAVDGALPELITYDGLHLRETAYEPWYHRIRFLLKQ